MFSSVLIRTLPPHCRIFSSQWCYCIIVTISNALDISTRHLRKWLLLSIENHRLDECVQMHVQLQPRILWLFKEMQMLSQHSGISSLLGTGKQGLSTWHASQAVKNGVYPQHKDISQKWHQKTQVSICDFLHSQ